MRFHIGKAFNSLKLTDYLEEEQEEVRYLCMEFPSSLFDTVPTSALCNNDRRTSDSSDQ